MDATKLRELTLDELQEKYSQYKEELFNHYEIGRASCRERV